MIFSDELNHASIIDGARLACRGPGVVLQVYRHNDLRHLAQLLEAAPARARKLVVTDSLFSMDGDYADLQVCVCGGGGLDWCFGGGGCAGFRVWLRVSPKPADLQVCGRA